MSSMASIFKSSKIIPTVFGLTRKADLFKFSHRNLYQYLQKFPAVYKAPTGHRQLFSAETNATSSDVIEKCIHQLNIDTKYKNYINLRDIEEILVALKQWNKLTYQQSLVLLQCCGSQFLSVRGEKKIKLIEEVMSVVESLGIKLDIIHYNILLTAYVENEWDFSPNEFLKNLNEKNVIPNKVTFQRLLKAYCSQGNISGASDLLEKMKNQNMSINEDIFNSLIIGHFEVKDSDSALAILDLMKEKGIEPSNETYLNLMCGFAKMGNIEKVREVQKTCKENNIELLTSDIFKVVYVLAINQHKQFIDELLNEAKVYQGLKRDAHLYMYKMLEKKLDDVALKIVKFFKETDDLEEGRKCVQNLIKYFAHNRSIKELLDICETLKNEDFSMSLISCAFKEVVSLEDNSKALELFRNMKMRHMPVHPHFFWPLLVKAAEQGNKEILILVKIMKNLNVPRNIDTCAKIIYPNYKFSSNCLLDLEKLRKAGIFSDVIPKLKLRDLISKNNLKEAEDLATHFFFNTNIDFYSNLMVEHIIKTKNVDFFVNMLYSLLHDEYISKEALQADSESESDSDFDKSDNNEIKGDSESIILKNLFSKLSKDASKCEEGLMVTLLQKMLEKKIFISQDIADRIQKKFVSESVIEVLAKLTKENFEFELNNNMLNNKSKTRDSKGISFILKRQINIIIDLVKSEERQKALQSCEELLSKFRDKKSLDENSSLHYRRLLKAFADKGDYKGVEVAYDIGVKLQIIPKNYFYPLVQALTISEEYEKATDLFCEKASQYEGKVPWANFLFTLIKLKNVQLLQKLTDSMTAIRGETFCLAMLLTQFAKLGKIKEIKNLIDSKNFQTSKKTLILSCIWLSKLDCIEGLENLMIATKNRVFLYRYNIYLHLLKLYIAHNKTDKVKDLWLSLEEENIVPGREFIHLSGNFLKNSGEPVPFVFNENEEKESISQSSRN